MALEPAEFGVAAQVPDLPFVQRGGVGSEYPADVGPPEAWGDRRVPVLRSVRVAVVVPVLRRPPEWPFLRGAAAHASQHELEGPARLVRAVGEITVVAGGVSHLDFALLPRPATGVSDWHITVLDSNTHLPLTGALVRAVLVPWVDPDSDWNPWRGTSDMGGNAMLLQVPGASNTLVVSAPGYFAKVTTLVIPVPTATVSKQLDSTPSLTITLDPIGAQNAVSNWSYFN